LLGCNNNSGSGASVSDVVSAAFLFGQLQTQFMRGCSWRINVKYCFGN